MNKLKMTAIKSLRELDVLIAEHIFGWAFYESKHGYWSARTPDGEYHTSFTPYYDSADGEQVTPEKSDIREIPYYSNEIEAAWAIESKVDDRVAYAWALAERIGISRYDINRGGLGEEEIFQIAFASPMDRCVAALRSVGIEVELELPE